MLETPWWERGLGRADFFSTWPLRNWSARTSLIIAYVAIYFWTDVFVPMLFALPLLWLMAYLADWPLPPLERKEDE